MKKFTPKTKLGKWSVGLIIGFFLLFAAMQILVVSGQKGGENLSDNLILAVAGILAGLSVIVSFICGTIGIIKQKERSVFVFIAILIGFFILVLIFGEIFSSH